MMQTVGNDEVGGIEKEGDRVKESLMAWGLDGTVDSILASRPAALGSILSVPKLFQIKNQCCRCLSTAHCLESRKRKSLNPSSTS